jgi:hypothetical protein
MFIVCNGHDLPSVVNLENVDTIIHPICMKMDMMKGFKQVA